MIIIYIAYVAIGAIAGVLSGLLGIGGGIITVPCLLLLFSYQHLPQAYVVQIAIATSLAAMIFNTAAATWAHTRRQNVLWNVLLKLIPGLILGSILGAILAVWLSGVVLEIAFGFFLFFLAYKFYRYKTAKTDTYKLPHPFALNCFSCTIGMLSNLLGIGGGSLTVPLLISFKIKDKNAIGTSVGATLVTTLCGTIAYLIIGIGAVDHPELFGLIDIPAFLMVGLSALFMAPYGAKLSHQLDPILVRKIFAVMLVLTGLSLIF